MKTTFTKKKMLLLGLVLTAYTLIVTPLIVINLQKQQDVRSKAAEIGTTPSPIFQTTATSCGSAPSDAMLIIDKSGSMNDKVGSAGTKLAGAKTAAKSFVDILAKDSRNYVGLVTFSNSGTLNNSLSSNYSSVKSNIDTIKADGETCIECGIKKASADLQTAYQQAQSTGRTGIKKTAILLTDGKANWIEGGNNKVDQTLAEQRALTAAQNAHTQNGTIFFTIGLGNDVNTTFLKQIATATGGQYYFSPTTDELNGIYTQISQILAKSTISGTVFNDTNANATLDTNESKIPGWTLQLYTSGQTTPKTVVTDSTGVFTFSDLCDGTYTLKQSLQSGWKQTLPPGNKDYSVSITNGTSATAKDFGVRKARCADGIDNDNNGVADSKDSTCHTDGNPGNPNSYDPNKDGEHGGNTCADAKDNNGNNLIDGADPICHTDGNATNPNTYDPNLPEITPTPTEGLTTLTITVFQHGIGNSGDNTNPTQSSLSNKNPLHASIPADIQVFNVNNQLVASGAGVIRYDPATGSYKSDLICSGGNSFQTGKYNIKVKTAYHLRRLLPGIQTITVGQNNDMPPITLVAGDITNDNLLNIRDYNMLLDCYSDLAAAPACSDQNKKTASDLNDDGKVNQVDYNLFLREISTQPGE